MNVRSLAAAVAAAAAVISVGGVASAQDRMGHGKMSGKMTGMHGKMSGKRAKMSGGVYVCKMCKGYFSAADAKKMHGMDPMGHKLVMMKKAPAGYKRMHAGKMMDHKTGGRM